MTREFFLQELSDLRYDHTIIGDRIIISHDKFFNFYTSEIPPGVEFRNMGYVDLGGLKYLPPGTVFANSGDVFILGVKVISKGVKFQNFGAVEIQGVPSVDPGVQFENETGVRFGGFISWKPSEIHGIENKRLLNKMIKEGIFSEQWSNEANS